MGRPKTEAATYKTLMVRLPAEILEAFKVGAAQERRSLNAQLVCVMEEWVQDREQKREHAFSSSKTD